MHEMHLNMSSGKRRQLLSKFPNRFWRLRHFFEDRRGLHLPSDHYNDVIMSVMASQITGVSIVCWFVGSSADQRKHQSSASLAFGWGIHRWPVNSPHKGPVMRKMFQFDDVIMIWHKICLESHVIDSPVRDCYKFCEVPACALANHACLYYRNQGQGKPI